LTPAILTIFAYLGTPSRTIAANSAGVLVTGSAPALPSASRVSGALTTATIPLHSGIHRVQRKQLL
jgi:hypothetical protein